MLASEWGQVRAFPRRTACWIALSRRATETGAFPEWARGKLHFVDSRIGLQCVEIPDILEWAQRSQLTSAPNPSYETTEVQISDRVARHLLGQLGIRQEDAKSWGATLRTEMRKAEEQLAGVGHTLVEEYLDTRRFAWRRGMTEMSDPEALRSELQARCSNALERAHGQGQFMGFAN